MKIGASSLAGIEYPLETTLEFVENLGLEYVELVHQFPTENIDVDVLESYNLKYSIHAPFIDVNIASVQNKSRSNSVEQIKDSIDFANKINAEAVKLSGDFCDRGNKIFDCYNIKTDGEFNVEKTIIGGVLKYQA